MRVKRNVPRRQAAGSLAVVVDVDACVDADVVCFDFVFFESESPEHAASSTTAARTAISGVVG
jgi:hypothetical protein